MKEEYLWDKSGAIDPEIERLESSLAAFRYQETDAPMLPAKIVPFERKTRRSFFPLVFPLTATCAVLAIIAVGFWFQILNGQNEVAGNLPEKQTIAFPVDEKTSNETLLTLPDDSVVGKVEIPKRAADQKIIKVRRIVPATVRRNRTIARHTNVKKQSVELTTDEKYAYDQLMLALSITSSTLKIVENKIYGSDEPRTILETER